MSTSDDMLLGRLAVHHQMITSQELVMVTAAQQRGGSVRNLGDTLLDEGLITDAQLAQLQHALREHLARTRPGLRPPTPVTPPAPAPAPAPAPVAPPAPAPRPPVAAAPPRPAPPLMDLDDLLRPYLDGPAAPPPSGPAPSAFAPPVFSAAPAKAPAAAAPALAPSTTQPVFGARASASAPPSFTAPPTITVLPSAATSAAVPAPPPPDDYAPAVAEVRRDGSLSPRNTNPTALHRVLGEAVRAGASDVHFHERSLLRFRINGRLTEMSEQLLSPYQVGKTIVAALNDAQYETLCREGEIDFPYTASGIGRFRVNLFKQQHGIDAVFHSVPAQPPSLEELGLPEALGKLANYHQGIVLFTGPSGCGKSATMGAVLNLVNRERTDHIITIEDPIETLHPSLRAIVNQRQAKKHTASFGRALKAALREDPDVIVIGEMRDYETISLAISAAETGHLVMGTLHTGGAIRTISRVLGVFPPAQQAQVRSMVSESLRAVVSQRLVARADGKGRVAALEILYVNQAVANLIRENRAIQIKSVLQTGISQGMSSLDNSLETLVKAGTIAREEAARHADEPKKFTNTGGS